MYVTMVRFAVGVVLVLVLVLVGGVVVETRRREKRGKYDIRVKPPKPRQASPAFTCGILAVFFSRCQARSGDQITDSMGLESMASGDGILTVPRHDPFWLRPTNLSLFSSAR